MEGNDVQAEKVDANTPAAKKNKKKGRKKPGKTVVKKK